MARLNGGGLGDGKSEDVDLEVKERANGLPELEIQKRKGIRVEIRDKASDDILKDMAIADKNGSVVVNEGRPADVRN
ncbi:hypothetical protein V6N11_037696 [Hibiscus sabdariffa]|uniref:Uncharacterized protein n=1 Tax=Hibiscus sabdariffa TaxID=183260 RepID=A0ABR2PC20_9ROSI